jgi:hypothetical protein
MLYERRRDLRYPIQLGAILLPTCGTAHTENVSYRGLLIKLDMLVVLGQLYRAALMVADEPPIPLHLVPMRHILGPDGAILAVGARILGHEPRWDRFVSDLQSLSGRRILAATPATPPPVSDRAPAKGVG